MATDTSASTKPAAPRLKLPAAMAGSLPLDASPVSSRSASRLQPSRPAPPPSPRRSGTWWPGGGPSLGAGRGALAPGASQDGQARSTIFCTSAKAPLPPPPPVALVPAWAAPPTAVPRQGAPLSEERIDASLSVVRDRGRKNDGGL
jgi:hypothetical protein